MIVRGGLNILFLLELPDMTRRIRFGQC